MNDFQQALSKLRTANSELKFAETTMDLKKLTVQQAQFRFEAGQAEYDIIVKAMTDYLESRNSMAAGLPVAATRIAGNEELVVDGETGFLVPSEAPAALAAVLTRLIGDRTLCRRLGAAGREKAVREYSWRTVAERYSALCREACSLRVRN